MEDIAQRFRAAGIPMAAPSIHVRSYILNPPVRLMSERTIIGR